MRTLSALLMVLLLCSLQQTCSGTQAIKTLNKECCSEFMKVKIPLRRIASYRYTTSDCTRKAVIFETVSGKNWCVDPEAAWVKKRMKKLNP